jgi:hypothetical protein
MLVFSRIRKKLLINERGLTVVTMRRTLPCRRSTITMVSCWNMFIPCDELNLTFTIHKDIYLQYHTRDNRKFRVVGVLVYPRS